MRLISDPHPSGYVLLHQLKELCTVYTLGLEVRHVLLELIMNQPDPNLRDFPVETEGGGKKHEGGRERGVWGAG